MLYLTCTTITSVDLAHYGVSRAKDWVSVDCGTKVFIVHSDLNRSVRNIFGMMSERGSIFSVWMRKKLCLKI